MEFFKDKKYTTIEIGLIKWSSILFGMVFGAYLSDFVLDYVWIFIVAALLMAIVPTIAYFKEER